MSDSPADIPPKLRRYIRFIGFVGMLVLIGATILAYFLDFWIVLLIVSLMAVLVSIPLAIAAAREKRKNQSEMERDFE